MKVHTLVDTNYKDREPWSNDHIIEYRNKRLRDYLVYCAKYVPYYKKLFKEIGFDPYKLSSLDDLKALPILNKRIVQKSYPEFISEIVPKNQRIILSTGGTTGSGFSFATTLSSIRQQYAIFWRYLNRHGIPFETWYGFFGGRKIVASTQKKPPFWRYNVPGKQIIFSAYHLGPETARYYLAELRKRRLDWLHGYPSVLFFLAKYMISTKTELGYKPRWITTASESLLPNQAEVISNAFGIKPIQHYGMTEAVANISECKQGCLHVDEDFSAVEFIPNSEGQGFRIVGTNFTNLAMPFLRYDTGDQARIYTGECSCGLPGRIISAIDGRIEDYVILKNGSFLGRLAHIFNQMPNILEAQIYQNKIGALVIRVVKDKNYSIRDEYRLKRELESRVGKETEVEIAYCNNLPRSKSGKLRFVISDLLEGKCHEVK